MRQRVMPDEIIIADDGSEAPTRQVVEHYRGISPVPVIHVWQEDKGFRLAEIRNKGIAVAKGQYIIQIDGDLILNDHFVYDHKQMAERGYFVSGTRAMVSPTRTHAMLQSRYSPLRWYSGGVYHRLNSIRSRVGRLIFTRMAKYRYVKGCNMAFWRDDLLKVNGYDENFVGWGGEDNDIAIRLGNAGVMKKRVKFHCVAFHLFHGTERDESNLEENEAICARSQKDGRQRCEKGVSQHLK